MSPHPFEQRVIDTAIDLASTLGADPNHTVAAAAIDTRGKIHKAVNLHHFTGGPCGEVAAMAVAATEHAGPLLAMAAAGDGGRGLLSPCGRCRQIMLDLHPDILVAIPTDSGPQMQSLGELLPGAYSYPDAAPARVLRFNRRYYEAVAGGTKTMTRRWNEAVPTGPVLCVFEDHPDWPVLPARVTAVDPRALSELDEQTAASLAEHYPHLPPDATIHEVGFELTTDS